MEKNNAKYISPIINECKPGTHLQLIVSGKSMVPLIKPGDRILLTIKHGDSYPLGSIVLAVIHNELVTHRLIYKTDEQYILKGDNLPTFDPPVSKKNIIGIVNEVARKNNPKRSIKVFNGKYSQAVNKIIRQFSIFHHRIYTFINQRSSTNSLFPGNRNFIRLLIASTVIIIRPLFILYIPLIRHKKP